MGRLDLRDPLRDEDVDAAPDPHRCVCCGARTAADTPDPRLPDLEVAACWDCRDLVAVWAGWVRCSRFALTATYWRSGDRRVAVVRQAAAA